jgi:hypothetical protein
LGGYELVQQIIARFEQLATEQDLCIGEAPVREMLKEFLVEEGYGWSV